MAISKITRKRWTLRASNVWPRKSVLVNPWAGQRLSEHRGSLTRALFTSGMEENKHESLDIFCRDTPSRVDSAAGVRADAICRSRDGRNFNRQRPCWQN